MGESLLFLCRSQEMIWALFSPHFNLQNDLTLVIVDISALMSKG